MAFFVSRRLVALSFLIIGFGLAGVACAAGSRQGPARDVERAARFERTSTPSALASGERRLVTMELTNLGSQTWVSGLQDGIRVSYHWRGPMNVWDGERTPLPGDIPPGATVEIVAAVVAPTVPGNYTLVWDLVDERVAWFGDAGGAVEVAVQVRAPESRAEWQSVRLPELLHADVMTLADVKVRNTGTVLWPATGEGAVLLSYHWRDLHGALVHWDGERTKLERPIAPGETVETKMRVAPPPAPGRYILELDLVRERIAWLDSTATRAVSVAPASYNQSIRLISAPKRVVLGQPVEVKLAVTNTGQAPWPSAGNRRTKLGYHILRADGQLALWDGARTDIGRSVDAGETVEVLATVRAPHETGRFTFRFDLVQERVRWFGEVNRTFDVAIDVVPLDFAAELTSLRSVNRMAAGTKYTGSISVRNAGSVTWPSGGFNPVRLGYHWIDAAGRAVLWDGPRTDLPKDLEPNQSVTLKIEITAPKEPGNYVLEVDMVQEYVAWFGQKSTKPARLPVLVATPTFAASWRDADVPRKVKAGGIFRAKVLVRNDGPLPWVSSGDHPVHVAHHWRDKANGILVWDGFRTEFAGDVQPGQTVTLEMWFFAPATPGEYVLEIDVVQEWVAWFADKGSKPLRQAVEVTP